MINIQSTQKKQQSPTLPNPSVLVQILQKSHLKLRATQTNIQSPFPPKRYNHISFIYKDKFYIHGGTSIPYSEFKEQKNILYCYDLSAKNKTLSNQSENQKQLKQPKDFKQSKDTKWKIIKTKFTATAQKQFKFVSGHCSCIINKKLYVFGGSNNLGACYNSLFKLDCETFQWTKSQQKGAVPKQREGAKMFHMNIQDKNYLVLYGGFNTERQQIYNDFYLYQLQIKTWIHCRSHYQNFISNRVNPSMCIKNDKIYLFGGYSVNIHDQQNYHNDFYQIQILPGNKTKQVQPYIHIRRLDTIYSNFHTTSPEPRQNASLICCQGGLLLIGGQKSHSSLQVETQDDIWLFVQNQSCRLWIKMEQSKSILKPRSCFSAVSYQGSGYLFGGLANYNNILSDFLKISIASKQQQIRKYCQQIKKSVYQNSICALCKKITQNKCFQAKRVVFPTNLILEAVEGIDFPFSAFGLLVDNAVNHGATFCNIDIIQKKFVQNYNEQNLTINNCRYNRVSNILKPREKYIRIQDDSQIAFEDDQFLTMFKTFQGGITSFVQGMDKKLKEEVRKGNIRRQYGTNLKLGCLRLGGQVLYVRYEKKDQKLRVCLIRREQKCQQGYIQKNMNLPNLDLKNGKFVFYSYQINRLKLLKIIRKSQMQFESTLEKYQPDQLIQYLIQNHETYSCLLRQAIFKISTQKSKNLLFILKLRDVQGQYVSQEQFQTAQFQLNSAPYQNDLIYGNMKLIKKLNDRFLPIYDCIDVSLKTYLTFLYLKCQVIISLSLPFRQPKTIQIQFQLQKIDTYLKIKTIIELQNILDFECKFVQLFFNPDLKNKMKLFCNGVLLYHRNRLINRFDVELGQLMNVITKVQNKSNNALCNNPHKEHANYMKLFGYIQVSEAVPINYGKNKFTYQIMMQKLYNRLKFVEEYCSKKITTKKQVSQHQSGHRKQQSDKKLSNRSQANMNVQISHSVNVKNSIKKDLNSDFNNINVINQDSNVKRIGLRQKKQYKRQYYVEKQDKHDRHDTQGKQQKQDKHQKQDKQDKPKSTERQNNYCGHNRPSSSNKQRNNSDLKIKLSQIFPEGFKYDQLNDHKSPKEQVRSNVLRGKQQVNNKQEERQQHKYIRMSEPKIKKQFQFSISQGSSISNQSGKEEIKCKQIHNFAQQEEGQQILSDNQNHSNNSRQSNNLKQFNSQRQSNSESSQSQPQKSEKNEQKYKHGQIRRRQNMQQNEQRSIKNNKYRENDAQSDGYLQNDSQEDKEYQENNPREANHSSDESQQKQKIINKRNKKQSFIIKLKGWNDQNQNQQQKLIQSRNQNEKQGMCQQNQNQQDQWLEYLKLQDFQNKLQLSEHEQISNKQKTEEVDPNNKILSPNAHEVSLVQVVEQNLMQNMMFKYKMMVQQNEEGDIKNTESLQNKILVKPSDNLNLINNPQQNQSNKNIYKSQKDQAQYFSFDSKDNQI